MTVRFSTGLRNNIANSGGLAAMFNRGRLEIYSGSQPVSADSAVTGTLLGIVTASSGTLTKETLAVGSVTLTGGASGSINTVTVGTFNIIPDGAVNYNTSLAQTAADLADAINRNGYYVASVSGAVVTIKPRFGTGAAHNGYVVTAGLTTITATFANIASGVDPANGLMFSAPNSGVISKLATQVWSFNGINGPGTAGWFRLFSSDTSDSGALIAAAPYYPRMDGSIAVSGADLNLSNISITTGAPNTIDTFNITIPAA